MNKRLLAVLIGSAALAAGCQQPVTMPSSTAVQLPASAAQGRSRSLSAASHMGFWIYKDEDSVWHLRATTQEIRHRFSGAIHPLPGTVITDLRPIAVRERDALDVVNGDIRFHLHPHEDTDGFDFRVTGPEAIEFALKIDEDYDPTHIYIGQRRVVPQEAHFILTP
ncbi:MAG TPA: hypothetical protein VHV47_02935 [Opitutaceae bacterium]|jgi:hypothetical protein|nr:hypothetical protein [Opitutaceae bacterium]